MFLEVILSLTTVIVFLAFALKPTIITIIALVREVNAKEELVAKLDKKNENLLSARTVYSQSGSAIAQVNQSVPTNPEIESLFKQTQGLANKNFVNLIGFSAGDVTIIGTPPEVKKTSDVKPLPDGAIGISTSISVSSASYGNISQFVKDLENFRRPMKVDSLQISTSTTKDGKSIVALISGRLPYLQNK